MTSQDLKTPRRISQRRIAEMLDLSTATVSRSLRNDASIHPATRARVLEAASKLGYRLPPSTRGLESDPTDTLTTIEVLIGHPTGFRGDPSSAGQEILAGISEGASAQNVHLSVHFVPPSDAEGLVDPTRLPPAMRAGVIQGVIILYPFPDDVVKALSLRFSCVSVVHHHPEFEVDCIDTDQRHAVKRIVAHLHELGHERIGFLTWGHGLSWEERRLSGYREGLIDCDLPYDSSFVLNRRGELPEADDRCDAVIAHSEREGITAWVCSADHIAYSLCRGLAKRGIVAGTDLSITGYDGMEPPPDSPQVTTVRVPFQDLGVAAVQRTVQRLANNTSPVRDILLRHEIVRGTTTAAPKR